MKIFNKIVLCTLGCVVSGSLTIPIVQAKSYNAYQYRSDNPAAFSVVTVNPDIPILLYLDSYYGITDVQDHPPLAEGVLAKIIYPNGKTVIIENEVPKSGYMPMQDTNYPMIANTCDADELEQGFPHQFTSVDLPYQQTFDTTLASDTGDFRGSAEDSISRPGGHDGYWIFTPTITGTYLFSLYATKGNSSPIPGHEDVEDFERGFGGIGVWHGECDALQEVGVANSITGDSNLAVSLEADTTYFVIWEDFFIGSTENSVRLSVDFAGEPIGNTLMESISLVDEGWNFEIIGDTTSNENFEDSSCVDTEVNGDGHGSGSSDDTGADIWYRLPNTTPGVEYTVSVLSDENTTFVDSALVLHAYNLTTHQVAEIACSDNISEDNRLSSITFTAEDNLFYYVMVESVTAFDQASFGTFILQGTTQTSTIPIWQSY